MKNQPDYCYSTDEEIFHNDLDGVKDDAWNNNPNLYIGDTVTIYRGVRVPKTHADYLSADDVIEQMAMSAYDDLNEFTDGYLENINEPMKEAFKKHMLKWLDLQVPQPHFFGVKDVEPFDVVLD
jgi:hypothetical protein